MKSTSVSTVLPLAIAVVMIVCALMLRIEVITTEFPIDILFLSIAGTLISAIGWKLTVNKNTQPQESLLIGRFKNNVLIHIDPNEELEVLRNFYRNIYWYIGNYPNWKVQQEYRQLFTTVIPNPHCEFTAPYHFHNIDHYLTKLVKETNAVSQHFPGLKVTLMEDDLAEFCGNQYLSEIEKIHPNTHKEPYLTTPQHK